LAAHGAAPQFQQSLNRLLKNVGSANGPLFAFSGNRGSVPTALWVTEGITFYLQDVSNGNPLTPGYTLAKVVVHLQKP
jgi:hypothetical protein